MGGLVEALERVAATGDHKGHAIVESKIRRAQWGIDEEAPKNPADTMVKSMIAVARRSDTDRAFVSALARGFGKHVAAQFGEASLRKAEADYGDTITDPKAIRRFGSLIKWALRKPGTEASIVASLTVDSVRFQLESRNQTKSAK